MKTRLHPLGSWGTLQFMPLSILALVGLLLSVPVDSGIPLFAGPLSDQAGPVRVERDSLGLTVSRGRFSLSIVDTAVAQSNGLLLGQTFLPQLATGLWGYADERIVGRFHGGRLIGLADRGIVMSNDDVLRQFRSWAARLQNQSLPSFSIVQRAEINPTPTWTMERSLRLLEELDLLLPGAQNCDVTMGPKRNAYVIRLVGHHRNADGSIALLSANLEITPRPAARRPGELIGSVSSETFCAYSFTTDHSLVNFDHAPGNAAGDINTWHANFADIEKE